MVDRRAPLTHGRVDGIEDAHISRYFMRSSRNTAQKCQDDRSSHAASAVCTMRLYKLTPEEDGVGRYLCYAAVLQHQHHVSPHDAIPFKQIENRVA